MEVAKLVEAASNQPILSVVIAIMVLGSPKFRSCVRTVAGDVRCVLDWFTGTPERAFQRLPRNFWGGAWAGWWLFACSALLLSFGCFSLLILLSGGGDPLPTFAALGYIGFCIGFVAQFMRATLVFIRGA